jgi:hypothetical protein
MVGEVLTVFVCVYVCMYVCMYACVYICAHTHTHTHMKIQDICAYRNGERGAKCLRVYVCTLHTHTHNFVVTYSTAVRYATT